MGKHTPGPWSLLVPHEMWCGRPIDDWAITVDDHDTWICTGPTWDADKQAESAANGLLIAAAPDSHAANVKFVEATDQLCGIKPSWSDERIYDELPSSGLANAYFAARAAIAKATAP